MYKIIYVACLLLSTGWHNGAFAVKITGEIVNKKLGLPVSAASVTIQGFGSTLSGPDGFFAFSKVPAGRYELLISATGYKTDSLFFSVDDRQGGAVLHILLEPVSSLLDTVKVVGSIDPGQEVYGRMLERSSVPLMHIISRQSIERSSDITAADMLQRVSGVSLLRDETGMPGKAIIRGMDPKYSYTSVNGMAVPSPDDKSRYLSLDLFPAGVVDHLEIHKTLTADMAGDAIGGRINIVTRTIPNDKEFSVQLATGYSRLFFQRSYLSFNNGVVQTKSPYERYGSGYYATGNDFTKDNLSFYSKQPFPDIQGNISWSKRFAHERLGVMIAAGAQTIRSGSDGFLVLQNNEPQIGNIPGITDFIKRQYSSTSNRKNVYAALDYKINDKNHLRLYELYINKLDIESRSAVDTSLSEGRSGPGTGRIALMQRSRLHRQSLEHLHLQGDHHLSNEFFIDWSAAYSQAFGSYPDWAELTANTGLILGSNGTINQTPLLLAPLKRTWLHNKETEKDLGMNFNYKPVMLQQQLELSAGALLQYRHRDNFYNYYLFTPEVTSGNGQPFTGIYDAVWFNNNGPQNPLGTVNTQGTYMAMETIAAWYLQAGFHMTNFKINAGLREEQTSQQVNSSADPGTPFSRNIGINYHDFLPSFNIMYSFKENQDLKFSYFGAVSRPALYDITFFNMDYDDYSIAGNPFLKRSTANNFDLRYELYQPGVIDVLQLAGFFKKINDPFERTLLSANDTLYPIPGNGLSYTPASKLTEQLRNYNTATNYGFEFCIVKNFGRLGITANYTFTNSRIEQTKKYKQRVDPQNQASDIITVSRLQQRPLQGQSKHLANMNICYRLPKYGWTAQLLGIYTGRRIAEVSGWYQLDDWQKGNMMVDFSLEKTIGTKWRLFAKFTNLLNTKTKIYVNGNISGIPGESESGKIIVEEVNSQGSMLIGAQFKLK